MDQMQCSTMKQPTEVLIRVPIIRAFELTAQNVKRYHLLPHIAPTMTLTVLRNFEDRA